MIWAYLIYLGSNMWFDWDNHIAMGYNEPKYHETMFTQKSAWRKIVKFAAQNGVNTLLIDMGEGVQYESVPEISCKGAWTKQELKEELDFIRSLGITPIPKFNFSAAHDAWFREYGRMLSTPQYYRAAENLICETVELFENPKLFHIGLEEEAFQHQAHMGICVCRNRRVFWNDVNFLFKILDKNKARPWIWGDGFWESPEEYIQNTPKEALVSPAIYVRLHTLTPEQFETGPMAAFRNLGNNGFDYVPIVSTCYTELSANDVMRYVRDICDTATLKGYMSSPWCRTSEQDIYCHYNDITRFASARKKFFGGKQ